MTESEKDDIYYVCSLIEYTARKTKNHRGAIVGRMTHDDMVHQLAAASVNHCLSFEQVSDEWIEDFAIPTGTFDTVAECRYPVPPFLSIGALYQELVLATMPPDDPAQGIINIFASFLSDAISDFNSGVYYTNPDYLRCSYLAGALLD